LRIRLTGHYKHLAHAQLRFFSIRHEGIRDDLAIMCLFRAQKIELWGYPFLRVTLTVRCFFPIFQPRVAECSHRVSQATEHEHRGSSGVRRAGRRGPERPLGRAKQAPARLGAAPGTPAEKSRAPPRRRPQMLLGASPVMCRGAVGVVFGATPRLKQNFAPADMTLLRAMDKRQGNGLQGAGHQERGSEPGT
jgi:hypothetical protein